MMLRERQVFTLAILLFSVAACGLWDESGGGMETKQTYSLCPKTSDARQRLFDQVRGLADRQGARLIDRGAGAQRELSGMDSGVLRNTGGEVIMLTVEKPNEFRISITNLGLEEKVALSVRSWGGTGEDAPVSKFMNGLDSFWKVERVDGSITNDPPC